MSARFALRSATAGDHERLDALFSRFDLTNRDGYGVFLLAQAGGFLGVEEALDRAGIADVVPDWPDRRRSNALVADLTALHLAVPTPSPAPSFFGEAAMLGGLYVLEGSRLGGAMLVRAVPDDLPKSFLSGGNPAAWRAFVHLLDQRLSSEPEVAAAARAAAGVFETFASSARRTLGEDDLAVRNRHG